MPAAWMNFCPSYLMGLILFLVRTVLAFLKVRCSASQLQELCLVALLYCYWMNAPLLWMQILSLRYWSASGLCLAKPALLLHTVLLLWQFVTIGLRFIMERSV